MAAGSYFGDPVEAARKRQQYPSMTGQSYFPAANTFANDPTAGSIFKPGFDPDNPLGGAPTPTPTPSPTPTARLYANLSTAAAMTRADQFNIANYLANRPITSATAGGQGLRSATNFPSIAAQTAGGQGLRTATQPGATSSPTPGGSLINTVGKVNQQTGRTEYQARQNDLYKAYGWGS